MLRNYTEGDPRWTYVARCITSDDPLQECHGCRFAVRQLASRELLYCGIVGHNGDTCENAMRGYTLWVREEDGNVRLVYPVERCQFSPGTTLRER